MNSLEFTILNNLVTNDQFRRQAFPYLKKEYFEEEHNKLLFDLISKDKLIMSKISKSKLNSIFNYSSHFKNVNLIFRRVIK